MAEDGLTWEEWCQTKRKPRMGTWFAERPALHARVNQLLAEGARPMDVWRWLVEEHQYPLSFDALYNYRARHVR